MIETYFIMANLSLGSYIFSTLINNQIKFEHIQIKICYYIDDDHDDDNDDDVCVLWLTDKRCLASFSAWTIARDPPHCESLTCGKQNLSLCRT